MDELEISGTRYISSRRAAKEYGYHSDYIGQLIRAKKVLGTKVGRAWYVGEDSLCAHLGVEKKPTPKESPAQSEVMPEDPPKKAELQRSGPFSITQRAPDTEFVHTPPPAASSPYMKPTLTYVRGDTPSSRVAVVPAALPKAPAFARPKRKSRVPVLLCGLVVCVAAFLASSLIEKKTVVAGGSVESSFAIDTEGGILGIYENTYSD